MNIPGWPRGARLAGAMLLLALGSACEIAPVNAPVVSRDALSQAGSAAGEVAAPKPGYYLVRRGDTLYSVAWQNGLSFRQLAEMNGIRAPYTIYAGQNLRIAPVADNPAPPLPGSRPGPPAAPASRAGTAPETAPGAISPSRVPTPLRPVKASTPVPAAKPVPEPATGEPALPEVVSHWVWPVKGPLLRVYTPQGTGKKGIDIGGKIGQPIVSAAAGRVVYSGSGLVGYGRLIIIKHNDSLLSAYGHNSELLVTEGDYVRAGQVIAKMGSSGTSSARLYFEIRQDGKPVNPLRYLPRG